MKEINYENLISQWHKDRNLIDGSTDKDQYMKLIQEAGELSDSLCKGNDIRDDIGDILVVLINIMKRNNLTINECLSIAYADIKDRKGKMVDGIFIKEEVDLNQFKIISYKKNPKLYRYEALTKSGIKLHILLRWKNGNGIAFPAFQIKRVKEL